MAAAKLVGQSQDQGDYSRLIPRFGPHHVAVSFGLAQAPAVEDGRFKVPPVLGEAP